MEHGLKKEFQKWKYCLFIITFPPSSTNKVPRSRLSRVFGRRMKKIHCLPAQPCFQASEKRPLELTVHTAKCGSKVYAG